MGVPGLKFTERRNDFPNRMKAVPDPGLGDRFVKNERPDTETPGQRLGAVARTGVDVEIRKQKTRKGDDDQRGSGDKQELSFAAHRLISQEQKSLRQKERGNRRLTETSEKCHS